MRRNEPKAITLTQKQYEDAIAEIIFQSCDGEFNWAECLVYGKEAAQLIDKMLATKK